MSYCHLNASINLALGFGHYPGDTVRANVLRAPCLTIGITPISTEVPAEFNLSQNYPNPFNPSTVIKFYVAKTGFVKLTVFDITGREVEVLAAEEMKAGVYQAEFDASRYASGLYFYKMETSDYVQTKKMMLIK
jgi:ribonucleotide reductase alpha subunit